jgi:hypothetical protein
LPAIGRIRQHFLVTGHRSVETDFADSGAGGAKGFTLENASVFKSEQGFHEEKQRSTSNVQRATLN